MAETAQALTLAVGDRVVYPNQGVCRVTSVESKEVAGQTLTFVTMKREEDGAVVMVPEAKVRSIGLRKVAGRADVEKVFAFLRSDSDKANLDWKQRARTNVERMSQGGLMGLAEVVKGLQVLSELRPLPTKERELYDNARHLLVAELAASLHVAEVDAEDAVDVVLFPPGRERPKRTAEEFRTGTGDEDGMELGEDLLELGGEMELGQEGEGEPEAVEAEAEEAAPPAKAKAGGKGKAEKKAPAEKKPAAEKKAADRKSVPKAEKKPAARPEKKAAAKPEKKPAAKPAAKKAPPKSAKRK
ncbi:MAG TPA: CarD family transcriptional regulator [Myxococcaceae bacterium]|nr:CarD family transcriptional regulator [Myxococcaceae bacterium]